MEKYKYIPSFARRGERQLSPRRLELVKNLLPGVCISNNTAGVKADALWLEIGFGAGEHLARQAEAHTDTLIIGCEIFKNGIASLLQYIDEKTLKNVRIFQNDARLLIENLPDSALDRVFILFPDPWPKRKHYKRRLINNETLDLLEKKLKPGAHLRFATDHMDYLRWTLAHMQNRKSLNWNAKRSSDWLLPPSNHYRTRYEEKKKTGDKPIFLDYTYTP